MKDEPWVEDENHRTIKGERWVARVCDGCTIGQAPFCELALAGGGCAKPKNFGSCLIRESGPSVRWYRLGSPALAFFDEPKEEPKPVTDPVRPLSEICMDGIRSSLKTFFQDRDRRAVEIMRDIRAASLDERVQAAMDAMLTAPDSFADPASDPAPEPAHATAPEDDVEIIIDPTPEQVPEEGVWGCCWDNRCDNSYIGVFRPGDIQPTWEHFAILVRGHLTPVELIARVRQILSEKEGK